MKFFCLQLWFYYCPAQDRCCPNWMWEECIPRSYFRLSEKLYVHVYFCTPQAHKSLTYVTDIRILNITNLHTQKKTKHTQSTVCGWRTEYQFSFFRLSCFRWSGLFFVWHCHLLTNPPLAHSSITPIGVHSKMLCFRVPIPASSTSFKG